MAKYLVKNTNEFRLVWAGRLRFRPGQQMWVKDTDLGLVQKHIDSGLFSVLSISGIVEEAAPAPAPEPVEVVETPAAEPEPVEEPKSAPSSEPEEKAEPEPVAYTESQLKSMLLAELRPLAESMGISHSGVRKAALIALILEAQG